MKELEKVNPNYIVPCHCTGWKATNRIIEIFPEKLYKQALAQHLTFRCKSDLDSKMDSLHFENFY
jgi:7,8-dihydropterin-6-yl-methyl-4-(beta-D-ribofuranosyl)aminobenzene 5'-phosphate synthase